ncbi:MAG: sulfotransferase domain-containing protein [Gemmatimonadota bacterium]|nr:sulfotransferase domain-containing protein [Gemmatimonadota bacterium]
MDTVIGPEEATLKRWFGRAKLYLGYYEARARRHEPEFRASLRPTDTFLVGHPKSGNTWVAYMLALLIQPDRSSDINLLNVGDFVPFVHGRDRDIANYAPLPDPRVFRNEYPLHARAYPRILYLVRDPRAVLVSFWHMYRVLFDDRTTGIGSFVEQYMYGSGCFRYWNKHLIRWDHQVRRNSRRAARSGNVLVVRYEDLVLDREDELRRIVSFLDLDADDRRLSEVAERGSFDAMRRVEERHGAEAYEGRARGEGRFIRKGRIDGWRDEMDEAIAGQVASTFASAMRLVGYE